ncbi:MAG: peptidase domain-containing ABC transporter, partial [Treponema sp.]|nr:peptidase domain-containing ABC transporter [Treponema sp.]
ISFFFSKIFSKLYNKSMVQNGKLQSLLFEIINGINTIKSLTAEPVTNGKYLYEKNESTILNWKINKFYIFNGYITTVVSLISNLLIYWYGASCIISGTLSVGTLLSFNSLLSFFSEPLLRLSNTQKELQESIIATRRLGEVLDLEEESQHKTFFVSSNVLTNDIVFKDVSFAYKRKLNVFNNLSLRIPSKKWTAIIGPSGCGKSTLIKLLLKFYNVNQGFISFGDISIEEIDTNFLRGKIGYVPQDIFLFSGSIKDNITFSHPEVSFEDVIEASKKAGAHDFIERLPKKYNTILGEHGTGLSGGEKQKIVLARALLCKPQLIILDEATSNLDKLSELEIYKVLTSLRNENITIVTIAHRLSSIKKCDHIIVMKAGEIIQQGNHNKLIKQKGLYHDMIINGEE